MQELNFTFSSTDIDDLGKTGIYAIVNQEMVFIFAGKGICKNYGVIIITQDTYKMLGISTVRKTLSLFVEPEFCIEVEQEYLDCAAPEFLYNMSPTAGSSQK